MQIKFLTIYGSPIHGVGSLNAQYDLLGFWRQSIMNDQVKPIKAAKVEFKEYSFFDYPDQEKLSKEIKKSIYSGYNHLHNKQFWQYAGKCYYIFEELYNDLAETHHLVELVITVEEE